MEEKISNNNTTREQNCGKILKGFAKIFGGIFLAAIQYKDAYAPYYPESNKWSYIKNPPITPETLEMPYPIIIFMDLCITAAGFYDVYDGIIGCCSPQHHEAE